MHCKYKTTGTCAKEIEYDIDGKKVSNIKFHGGCPGNLQILSKILNNWEAEKIIDMCKGNICGARNTSCANELAKSLEKTLEEQKQEA